MKLEIKHLAPYLPYGLKCKWNQSLPMLLVGLQNGNESVNNELWILKDGTDFNYLIGYLYECKPILRPLSDLTKEIEVNGEKFVPSKEYHYLRFEEISNYKGGSSTLGFIQAREQDILLELHFDIFGLIDNNLAIDINDIT